MTTIPPTRPTAGPPAQGPHTGTSRRDRVGLALGIVATVLGLWLGITAPDTSPVTPSTPTAAVGAAP